MLAFIISIITSIISFTLTTIIIQSILYRFESKRRDEIMECYLEDRSKERRLRTDKARE